MPALRQSYVKVTVRLAGSYTTEWFDVVARDLSPHMALRLKQHLKNQHPKARVRTMPSRRHGKSDRQDYLVVIQENGKRSPWDSRKMRD